MSLLPALDRSEIDPIYHLEEVQGITTAEEFQKRIILSVAQHERTVVSACHDIGKTWTASCVVRWFTSTFMGAKVITTAPTFNQVKRLLWSEIRAGFVKSKYPLGGEMLMTEWKISEDWFAVGFTSRNEKSEGEGQGGASSFQGFHAPAILVVFDEATGIAPSMWKQVEGIMTSKFVRFLGIGNPTTKACEFFKCFSDPSYKKIHLSCFDSPNFSANGFRDVEDLKTEYTRLKEMSQDDQYEALQQYFTPNTHLLTVKWVMQMILKWGFKHPLVVSKCFGQFPEEDESTLMSLGVVQLAQYRERPAIKKNDRVSIGVDVARRGRDKTVLTKLKGVQTVKRKVMLLKDANEVSGELVNWINEEIESPDGSDNIVLVIDGTGVGSGVVDALNQAQLEKAIPNNVEIREVHFGQGPGGRKGTEEETKLKKKFLNLKARMFFHLAEDLKTVLCLSEEDVYLEELPTIRYRFDAKGKWVIESKEDYCKRTGRESPDDSDSLALANYGRYEHWGVGEFTRDLNSSQNNTIINYPRDINLW